MLVDFNTAIQYIRNANLDMVELINQWKNLLSTTPADVAFTFADGSSVSFPNLAKLIAEYGSFPYNNLEFKVNDDDDGNSYHSAIVNPDSIILNRYVSGQPGTTKYIKMINDGSNLGLTIYSYSGGYGITTKVASEEFSISSVSGASSFTRSAATFKSASGIESRLGYSALTFTNNTDSALSKSSKFSAEEVSYEQAVTGSTKKYQFSVTKDQFFYGRSEVIQGGTRYAGLKVYLDNSDEYVLSFEGGVGYGHHALQSSSSRFSWSSGYKNSAVGFNYEGSVLSGGSYYDTFKLGEGTLILEHVARSSSDSSYKLKIDSTGIWKDDTCVLAFSK